MSDDLVQLTSGVTGGSSERPTRTPETSSPASPEPEVMNANEQRNWRKRILEHVRVMRVAPGDVLVWRLPLEVLNDEDEMVKARAIAHEFAEVCRHPILILEEGTDLKAEHIPKQRQQPVIHLPRHLR